MKSQLVCAYILGINLVSATESKESKKVVPLILTMCVHCVLEKGALGDIISSSFIIQLKET